MFTLLLKLRDLLTAIKGRDVNGIVTALEAIATIEGFDSYATAAKNALAAIRAGNYRELADTLGHFISDDIAPLLPTGNAAPVVQAHPPADLDALCDRGIALCDDARKVSAAPGQRVAFGPIAIGLFELALDLIPKMVDLLRERRKGPQIVESPAS